MMSTDPMTERQVQPLPHTAQSVKSAKYTSKLVKDRIYENILLDIVCGILPPGGSLEENELAQRYASGKYGVRDALQRLALEGLVTRRPRVGTTVRELSLIDLQQVFECRVLVESHCATLAAQRASAPEIDNIRRSYDGVEAVLEQRDWKTLVRMDQAFHRGLAAATHNEHLISMVTIFHNNALRFWHYALSRRPIEALLWEVGQHLEVVSALEARDPEAANAAMRRVLGSFPKSVKNLLSSHLE